jgi:integrase
MPRFTEGFADKLKVPEGARDVQAFDDELAGFGVRKFDTGKASYFVKYNIGKQQRRKTLGAVVRGNLKAMRLEASAILAKARLGTDVVAVARAAAAKSTATLGEVVPRYLQAREGELRASSLREFTRYLERSWEPLHALPIDAITRQHVVSVVDDLELTSGKVSADRARITLSNLLAWAIDRGYLDSNPTLGVRLRAQNGSRTRVLTEAELVAVWRACEGAGEYGCVIRLLILTGSRRSEIGGLSRSEVDLGKRQIALPEHRTKNGRAHIVPLSAQAIAILDAAPHYQGRDLVFGRGLGGLGGWSRAKADLDARIAAGRRGKPMPAWTLHDLRRSFVTHISERGFAQPHVVEALVNHVSGSKAGVAGVYNRSVYAAEKRRAIELWGAHVAALVAPLIPNQRPGTDKTAHSAEHASCGTLV